ncbi:ABC transporter permease subunit [Pasteurella bettyae]|uniref:Peptide transport system permease protein SapC n=1 Tax=Pasteurella bettyae CCUG 2042 TaxID=1095749 RepID=I3DEN3_9PAST|nr:ABC transporter permease subunit [Pasteurella bettyae]EIJ70176.1 peptide transport system permease protein SapC [Pasteurella bettyae CCUG 2042]SUB21994.1 peptide transport system permease SapC [Pasteurella bettyae]
MQDKEPYEFRNTEAVKAIWYIFRRSRITMFSLYAFIGLILLAILSPFITPYNSNTQFIGQELIPPSWFPDGEVIYFFGTDDIGRDLLSRLIAGVTYTFGSATIVIIFTGILGGILGIIAGMSTGIRSRILSHFLDAFLSVPILLIAMIIATLMEASLFNAMLAIFLALLPHFIHEIYQAIQQELKKEYVLMLQLDGSSNIELLKETILPNISVHYIKELTRAFVVAILDISALSFISLGAQRPAPEWGAMIRDSLELIYLAPWTVILPGIAIITSSLIVIILGTGISKAIEKYYK